MNIQSDLLTPKEARAALGLKNLTTFWKTIHENYELVKPVRYSQRCVRFPVAGIKALREKFTVRSQEDVRRLVDGRRA